MAKGFSESNGSAKKGGTYYKWVDGDQTLRLVGDIVPRYSYWKRTPDGKNISIECLAFDRDQEKFTNVEKDWFKELLGTDDNGKEIHCSWSYVCRAIDPKDDTKTVLIPMKKKLYQQIMDVAAELGDPTDVDKGWDLPIERKKTGTQAFNVEYNLKQLKCKNTALNDVQKETVANMPDIDTLVPRPTADEQHKFILATFFGGDETTEDAEAVNELEG